MYHITTVGIMNEAAQDGSCTSTASPLIRGFGQRKTRCRSTREQWLSMRKKNMLSTQERREKWKLSLSYMVHRIFSSLISTLRQK